MQAKNVAKTIGALLVAAAPLSHAGTDGAADPLYNDVRLGLYYVHFFSNANDISGPFTPPGLNVSVKDVVTLYAAYVRRLNDRFDVELAFGAPPLTKTQGSGPATVGSVPFNNQVLATARWFAPTALLEYKLLDDSHQWQPFVGLGVNYTRFYSRQFTAAGNAVAGGPTSYSLPVSVGFAATVGVHYRLSERWKLHASYSASRVHSQLTSDTAGVIRTTDSDFWPGALVVSAGYSF
jgi:outer membrane protein